ncbi:DUF4301 family protein [Crocinitomix catalasitica]|uniref:DUF4301 family protein n=1 Tax=Crocinitomix catalasitica TaxID=184607 RepID=UPI000687B683|nr:DUF4301 family protein [Crocinitomix catalasitica]
MNLEEKINLQKSKLQNGNPTIELSHPCRIGNGIISLSQSDSIESAKKFEQLIKDLEVYFFIPASGSGSRMFGSLFDFIKDGAPNDDTIEFIEHLLNSIEDFAFYNKLSLEVKNKLKSGEIEVNQFIELLITEKGFNFGHLPKGLIPFHKYGHFILNPFQEHILQGTQISGDKANFHFTIAEPFEDKIKHSIKILREITGFDFSFEFSLQDPATNSIAFTEGMEPAVNDSGNVIMRPAGHGALLKNLNDIQTDLIFIRNIDNIQHNNFAEVSIQTRKALGGVLVEFQQRAFKILQSIDNNTYQPEEFIELNKKFDLQVDQVLFDHPEEIYKILNRPIRICGMVKNEGQPGGGPFWIKDTDGKLSKQIVEKSQISTNSKQLGILIKSTHFNPVEIICAPKNYKGEKFDLFDFRDENKYFIVKKNAQGQDVKFIEEPGLWNGGMAKWTTLFYQIDSNCFSPVKTVLDLLKPLHREK